MQFGDKKTPPRDLQARQRAWDEWRQRVRNMPHVIRFAQRWAQLMELEKSQHPNTQIAKIADRTLAQLDRHSLTDHQFRMVVGVLCECWRHQLGLRNWALGKRWLPEPDKPAH